VDVVCDVVWWRTDTRVKDGGVSGLWVRCVVQAH
jgi:hypothetical protein